ncbi:MAG: protein kinase [Gemmatimonadetes bacterium]|nr:protein kinase [Gemmatimonadota bacterium]
MIGKRIGRYVIEGELGRGGMGVVYRATQVSLNRAVAVKMLPDHLASSSDYLNRFRREAETLAKLQHPSIVHIYDVEEADGSHFIVMEYVDGPSLSDLLRAEGRLSPAKARDVAHALADGLTAAHRKGIVHRDIKPDNILFTSEGRPKLTDFGVAHMRDSNVRTQTGVMLGTPYYMSPEQAGGKPVTAASDVYSLGVVLFEMVSGRVPFDADTPVAVALKHIKEPPPRLSDLAPDTPPGFAQVVARALAKEPGGRFRSMSELSRSLVALDLPTHAASASLAPVPDERCRGCGAGLRPEFMTCPQCGLAVRDACSSCGQLYPTGRDRCPTCGFETDTGRRAPNPTEGTSRAGGSDRSGAEEALRKLAGVPAWLAARARRWTKGEPPIRAWLERPIAGLPAPMVAGIGLVGVALVLAVFQLVSGERSGATRQTDIRDVSSLASGSSSPRGSGTDNSDRSRVGSAVSVTPRAGTRAPAPTVDPPDAAPGPAQPARDSVPQSRTPPSTADEASPPTPSVVDGGSGSAGPLGEPGAGAAFDEPAARAAILSIVHRQQRATETGDVELFLRDLSPELRDDQREAFEEMRDVADAVRSSVRDVKIEFEDATRAIVEMRIKLDVRLPGEDDWTTAFDDDVTWDVSRSTDGWLITDAG